MSRGKSYIFDGLFRPLIIVYHIRIDLLIDFMFIFCEFTVKKWFQAKKTENLWYNYVVQQNIKPRKERFRL